MLDKMQPLWNEALANCGTVSENIAEINEKFYEMTGSPNWPQNSAKV